MRKKIANEIPGAFKRYVLNAVDVGWCCQFELSNASNGSLYGSCLMTARGKDEGSTPPSMVVGIGVPLIRCSRCVAGFTVVASSAIVRLAGGLCPRRCWAGGVPRCQPKLRSAPLCTQVIQRGRAASSLGYCMQYSSRGVWIILQDSVTHIQ